MGAILLEGRVVARTLNRALAERIRALPRPPGLAVILVGEDPASRTYIANKGATADRLGIRNWQIDLPESTSEADLLSEIRRLNDDRDVDGVLVQLPLPSHIHRDRVLDQVRPDKDVDCFHPENVGRLALGRPHFAPCTPKGIMALLQHYEVPVEGRNAVIIGRSPIVGKPLYFLLERANATVTLCHSRTRGLADHVRRADIVIAAIGRAEIIPGEWIAPGAAVVDVGTNRRDDGTPCGDVHFASAVERAAWISPVPGGVGPMTIAMLMANTTHAAAAHMGIENPLAC